MKIGIMQPYFFPYLGYWQLMNVVDKYVIYDDVNYIKGGWINRNRILSNGQATYFNLGLKGASPNKLINEIDINSDEKIIAKNLRKIEGCYCKAPFFNEVFPLIKLIMENKSTNLASFLIFSIKTIAKYLDIKTEFFVSSDLYKNNLLRGSDKVISICKELKASEYYNAIGGISLYSFEEFEKYDIKLRFIKTNLNEYTQYNNVFQPGLSIIDIMMFNSVSNIKKMLNNFEVIQKQNKEGGN